MLKQFKDLGIQEQILKAIADLNFSEPTSIQEKSIPIILKNQNDIVALSKTGTGKTAAFGLPLLQLIDTNSTEIQAVILVPTRELGHQIYTNLKRFSKHLLQIKSVEICGGVPIKPQILSLALNPQIVVATPGRLIDLIQRKAINISKTKFLVLDEADEMVSILNDSLKEIVAEIPKNHRTFLFSATMPGDVKQLVQNYLHKNTIEINVINGSQKELEIEHQYIIVNPEEKLDVLMHFLQSKVGQQGIIFCRTKAAVQKLAKNLAIHKFSSGALHGSLSQGIRDKIMEQFRQGHISILVATDLAARGIDVSNLGYIVNYHLPEVPEVYLHRSGRTGRAGAKGFCLTVLQPEETKEVDDFETFLGIKFSKYQKPSDIEIQENNIVLWSKQIVKTKPNHTVSADCRDKVKFNFQHLSKEELIEKLIASQVLLG